MRRALAFAALVLAGSAGVVGAVGCSPQRPSELPASASPEMVAASKTWWSRCGGCHTRIEPGARSRAALDVAMVRHRKRVKLTEEEWRGVVAFLANDARVASPAPAAAPFPAPESTPPSLFPLGAPPPPETTAPLSPLGVPPAPPSSAAAPNDVR